MTAGDDQWSHWSEVKTKSHATSSQGLADQQLEIEKLRHFLEAHKKAMQVQIRRKQQEVVRWRSSRWQQMASSHHLQLAALNLILLVWTPGIFAYYQMMEGGHRVPVWLLYIKTRSLYLYIWAETGPSMVDALRISRDGLSARSRVLATRTY